MERKELSNETIRGEQDAPVDPEQQLTERMYVLVREKIQHPIFDNVEEKAVFEKQVAKFDENVKQLIRWHQEKKENATREYPSAFLPLVEWAHAIYKFKGTELSIFETLLTMFNQRFTDPNNYHIKTMVQVTTSLNALYKSLDYYWRLQQRDFGSVSSDFLNFLKQELSKKTELLKKIMLNQAYGHLESFIEETDALTAYLQFTIAINQMPDEGRVEFVEFAIKGLLNRYDPYNLAESHAEKIRLLKQSNNILQFLNEFYRELRRKSWVYQENGVNLYQTLIKQAKDLLSSPNSTEDELFQFYLYINNIKNAFTDLSGFTDEFENFLRARPRSEGDIADLNLIARNEARLLYLCINKKPATEFSSLLEPRVRLLKAWNQLYDELNRMDSVFENKIKVKNKAIEIAKKDRQIVGNALSQDGLLPDESDIEKIKLHHEAILALFVYANNFEMLLDKTSSIYQKRGDLLDSRLREFDRVVAKDDNKKLNEFVTSLKAQNDLISKLDRLNAELKGQRTDHPNVNKTGMRVYQDSQARIYNLLKGSSPKKDRIDFMKSCMENAAGVVKYRGKGRSRNYINGLIINADEASGRPWVGVKYSGLLLGLAGAAALAIGLAIPGLNIAIAIGGGAALAAGTAGFFGGMRWRQSQALHQLAVEAKAAMPPGYYPEKSSWWSRLSRKSAEPRILLPDQKKLMRQVLAEIKKGNLSDDTVASLYNATKGNTPPANAILRHFIEQHIAPHLNNEDLYDLTKAIMNHHLEHDSDSYMLRTSGILSTALYEQFGNRIQYEADSPQQPDTMVALNKIVLSSMEKKKKEDTTLGDPRNAAVEGIFFKFLPKSLNKEPLLDSFNKSNEDLDLEFDSDDDEDREESMPDLENAVSDDVNLPVHEKVSDLSIRDRAVIKLLELNEKIQGLDQNENDDSVPRLQVFIQAAHANIIAEEKKSIPQEAKETEFNRIFNDLNEVERTLHFNAPASTDPGPSARGYG